MTSPSSPSVQVSTCTSSPRATWWAMATPVASVSSSGCACTKSRRGPAALDVEAVEQPGHRTTAMSANSTTPPATVLADRFRTSEPAM